MLTFLVTACLFGFFPYSILAQSPVQVSVYYESMCPDSDSFFHQQLAPTYEKLGSYMTVDLVPYGNARYSGKPDSYRFSCQHGPEECYGNMVQACFITLVNITAEQIKFINCAFNVGYQRKTLEKCIDNLEVRRRVKKCVTSPMGNNLLYQMAKRTDDLAPPHNFIPWITINGKGGSDMNNRILQNFMNAVCDEFLTDKPDECRIAKQDIYRRFRSNYF